MLIRGSARDLRRVDGAKTLEQRALSVIRSLGGDAIYVQNGFPRLWTDSAGAAPVTAVGNVIGRAVGRVSRLGNELGTGPWINTYATKFDTFSSSGPSGFVGTISSARSNVRVAVPVNTAVNGLYDISFVMTHTGITNPVGFIGANNTLSGTDWGIGSQTITSGVRRTVRSVRTGSLPNTHIMFVFTASGAASVTLTDFSIKEVSMSAYQATTANKPAVSAPSAGRLAMSFDGVNDFLQTGITTGNQGWVCAGITPTKVTSGYEVVFNSGAMDSTTPGISLDRINPGVSGIRIVSAGGGLIRQVTSRVLPTVGVPQVVDGGWSSSTTLVATNGIEDSTTGISFTGGSIAALSIGRMYNGLGTVLQGPATAFIYTPVLPSASQRQLIRRWVGSLQGQTL